MTGRSSRHWSPCPRQTSWSTPVANRPSLTLWRTRSPLPTPSTCSAPSSVGMGFDCSKASLRHTAEQGNGCASSPRCSPGPPNAKRSIGWWRVARRSRCRTTRSPRASMRRHGSSAATPASRRPTSARRICRSLRSWTVWNGTCGSRRWAHPTSLRSSTPHSTRTGKAPNTNPTTRSATDTRRDALASLRTGRVRALFAVDLFNEGVDLPEVDTLLFLRPTESALVFLQQLG